MEEYLEFAIGIAKYAGEKMMDSFSIDKTINFKDDRTIVTEIDKNINHYLIEKVKEKYPDHSVIGEEEVLNNQSTNVWVCDPIDGTRMFTYGVPVSVFSLAFVVDGEVQVGVVYDPFKREMYTAIRGKGAYCNGKIIQVNQLHLGDLGYSLNFEIWENAKFDTMGIANSLLSEAKISCIGSVARACTLIARGYMSCDLFPGVDHGNCDVAAASLIVEEAGGMVTDFFGNTQRYDGPINGAIITNRTSHKDILEKVKGMIK
jgi:fructose-1,6-bisphosphatase/inositol monophosphatase family enzyme